jgi:hypothetical protein
MASSEPNNHEILLQTALSNDVSSVAANNNKGHDLITNSADVISHNNTLAMQSMPMQTEQSLSSSSFHVSTSTNNVKNEQQEAAATTTEIVDMEIWANSLVGRWWEIFWEPNEDNDDDDDAEGEGDRGVINDSAEDVVMSIRGGGVEDDNGNNGSITMDTTTQSSNNNNTVVAAAVRQQQQQSPMPTIHHHHRERPRNTATATQQRRRTSQPQQPYQHRPRFLDYDATKNAQQQQQQQLAPPPSQPQPVTRPQPQSTSTTTTRPQTLLYDAVYHGPKLGLSLSKGGAGNNTNQITITGIAPNAPNSNLVQIGDVVIGINGKRFPTTTINSSSATIDRTTKVNDFNLVITALRDTPRPMTVNFERRMVVSTNTTTTTTTTTPKSNSVVAVAATVSNYEGGRSNIIQSVSSNQVVVQPQQLGLDRDVEHLPTLSSNSAIMRHSTATEKELQHPLEPATDFPQGWTKRVIPRDNVSAGKKAFDTYYYSPVQGYKFRSRPEVRLFLELLARVGGDDETIAMEEYRREKSRKRSERKTTTTTTTAAAATTATTMPQSTAMDEDEKEPFNRLQKEMGERKRRQNSLDDSQSDSDATSTADDDDDDDDDAGKDAIDWYDGKILSFADGNFVVYFLGDAEDVTYTMPLTPKIVRPSVRAWTKRTLALLSYDIDLTKEAVRNDEIADSLPPSTALPQDENELLSCAVSRNGDASNHYRRLMEYGKLLETQIQLAKQLSPHADDDQSGGTVDGEDEGPGPFANKSYVKHLCTCLEESKKVYDWLSNEVDAMNVFKRLNDGTSCSVQDSLATTAPISKESIQSFLVNGTTFLQRILALIPNKIDTVPNEPIGRNGRKRRRANTNELSEQRQQSSEHLVPNIVVSPDSLGEAINSILNESGEVKQQMLITSTLKQIISVLHLDLWKPHEDWIKEAEDMIYGKSTTFYSFEEVESHIQAAQKLTMFDISSWRIDLEAKLNRARFFEMEAWSAIKACTTLDDNNGGNTTAALSDSCLLALNRLQNEISSSTQTAGEQSMMRNMNPLGKQSVSANGTHSLTRDDIENAIQTRQWILDLMQAKTTRERASFVQVSYWSSRRHLKFPLSLSNYLP